MNFEGQKQWKWNSIWIMWNWWELRGGGKMVSLFLSFLANLWFFFFWMSVFFILVLKKLKCRLLCFGGLLFEENPMHIPKFFVFFILIIFFYWHFLPFLKYIFLRFCLPFLVFNVIIYGGKEIWGRPF